MKKYWKKNTGILIAALITGTCASVFSAGVSIILQKVIDVAVSKQTELFVKLFLFTILYILFLCAIHFLSSLISKYLTQKMIKQYRQDVFQGIIHRRPAPYFQENTSDYVSALTNDMKLVEENYITALLNTFELLILFAATLGLLIFLSPAVTAILVLTLLLMFLIPAGIGGILEKKQDSVSRQMSVFTGKLKEFFSGYEVLKSYNRIENAVSQFQTENEKEIHTRFQAARLFALNEGLSDTLSVLSTITVIFVAAYLVLVGKITMGTLLALVQLSSSFMAPVILIMQNIPKIRSMKAVIARLNQYSANEAHGETRQNIPTFDRTIEFQDLSFSYDGNGTLLSGITFQIEKGKKYAIMGQSGCGKSTLVRLLSGYYDDYQGAILYDGQELRTLNPDKAAALSAVIHQNVYLFNESIRENILLHESFSEQELEQAVKKSGAAMFIEEKGLDHIAGENGAALSGGQKQRITLARALIRHAPLLILDEGTSALDKKTAHEIEDSLLRDEEITLLTITHNPDPGLMERYDEIYYMENGRLEKQPETSYTG
ncbi:MAG: ABC transporter ATP-binding protein [Dorea sp.]|jgi:ABC-type multidrug transport system fused ATPase/permease subunit|nr:ABC transporter ATP-binding protein [Dorea sp.]